MCSNQDSSQSKKKETRAGTRRVTSLTAEQLERKRANDREAQRTIRQRTREHIERLELQVAELRAKGDKFDEIMRRNALLETEIRALRHQLSMATGSPGFQNMEEPYSQQQASLMPSPQYPEALGPNPTSRTPSALSTSSQISTSRDWPPYSSTRSSSKCESSDTEYPVKVEPGYPVKVEPWAFEGPSPVPVSMSVQHPHIAYHSQGTAHLPEPAFQQQYQQMYHAPNPGRPAGLELPPHHQHLPEVTYESAQRPVSAPSESQTAPYPTLHPPPQFQQLPTHPAQIPRSGYEYDWVPRS
ncbi:hypothetical protein BDW74DRAFT_143720 [Aspergillus multicolor]|uniref:uncharacterized protein n=1 Tax=Aspergillus multicolor TaxID=41759 RepID=UPI003CCCEC01